MSIAVEAGWEMLDVEVEEAQDVAAMRISSSVDRKDALP